MRSIYCGTWFLLWSALGAFADPTPYEATYRADFKGLPVTAKGIRTLERRPDGRYVLTSEARSFLANVQERSTFRWHDGQVVPEMYVYERRGIGRNREEKTRFTLPGDAPPPAAQGTDTMAIDKGVTDTLNYQLQMREDIARAYAERTGETRFTYHIADGGRTKEYSFEVQGEELLETSLGTLRTLRLARVGGSSKRETIIWLARDWENLLVRLKQIEKGIGSFDLILDSATLGGKPVTPYKD